MKVSIILGTRPQIIKSAPVYSALGETGIECDIVNTGQHYDYEMNRQFFAELALPEPSLDLGVGGGSPSSQVAAIVSGLGDHFARHRPDIAIVPGDTNSALAAGIACLKSGVAVAHLEAGCRSWDIRMAEEMNRRLLDHMAEVLLCPTKSCVRNVKQERVLARGVYNVGDTMFDSLLKLLPKVRASDAPERHGLRRGEYAFMTLHRAETVDDPEALQKVIRAVESLPITVAFSVHPRTKARMREFGTTLGKNVQPLGPLPYIDTLGMVDGSSLVITDSGGLQKEAFWLGRPSLIPRERTEWEEIVRAGGAFLTGTSASRFKVGYEKSLKAGTRPFTGSKKIFGDGKASVKVARRISSFLAASGRD